MGKQKPVTEPQPPPPPVSAAPSGPCKFRVTLSGGPPIQFPSLEIDADDGELAKEEFCRRNGISDSVNKWTIERIS